MNKKQTTHLMTSGNILKQILVFAIPIFISSLFQQLYNAVDSAVVGIVDGSASIASVGTVGPIISLIVGFFLGLTAGTSSIVARYFGREDKENIEKTVHTAMALSYIAGIIIMVIGFFVSKPLLILINSPAETLDLSTSYLKIYFIGVIPMIIYNVASGILQGVGDSKRPLYYLVVAGVANVVLDIIFVAVFHLGVDGTAYATVIAQFISATLVLLRICKTTDVYKYCFKMTKIHKEHALQILKIGIPAGMQSAFFAIANLIIQGSINSYGTSVMAGVTAYAKIDAFLYMPSSAFGITTMTFVSQNVGVQNIKRAKKGINTALFLSISITALEVIIVMLVSKDLITMFTKGDSIAIDTGVLMMYCLAPFTIIYAFIEVFSGALKATGATLQALLITLATICIFRIIWISVLSVFYKNILVVFLSYPISWILCTLIYSFYYFSGRWLKKYNRLLLNGNLNNL